jgi:hypothetical protein
MRVRRSAAAIAAATPTNRDRYVDLLRVLAISAVVYGHWLIAVVAYRDGHLDADYLLLVVPSTQYFTWLFQVMPVFFLVGGYANAASLRSAQRHGASAADWLRVRWRRLLGPTLVLVGCWIALALVLSLAGLDRGLILTGVLHALGPLWFLGIYIFVVGAAPVTMRLHDRYGWRVVAALITLAAATDVAHLAFKVPLIGWTNCAWVWLAMHQLGYCWQDQTLLASHWRGWALLVGGAVAFGLLVVPGPYPISMVDRANTAPPTVALLALGLFHTGLVLVLRSTVSRWLQRPRVWMTVATANAVVMTLYLWHVTALVLVVLAFVLPGVWPNARAGSLLWWTLRPLWLMMLTAATIPIVALFSRVERRLASTPG